MIGRAGRPKAILVVAGFLFVAAAIAAIVGTSLLFPGPLLDRLWELNPEGAALFRRIGRKSGLFLWAIGAIALTAGLGFLRGRKWSWWIAVVLFVVDGIGDLVSYFLIHDALRTIFGVLVCSAFLYALTRPGVRRYFNSGIHAPSRPFRLP